MLHLIPFFVGISAVINAAIISATPASSRDGERNFIIDNQPLFKNAVGSPGPVESEKSRAPLINQIEPCSSEKAILARVKNNAKQLKDKLAPSV